jgi:hypothetical protein
LGEGQLTQAVYRVRTILAALLLTAPINGTVAAETETFALPDPATITVPDLSSSGSDEVVANGWKYFFFQKPAVSFADAYADLSFCYRYQGNSNWGTVGVPRFVPWKEAAPDKTADTSSPITTQYGLLGYGMGALVMGMLEGTLVRRDQQSKMRRCMETRGYTRYGVAEEIWENVRGMEPADAIAIQAKIASGPDFGGKVPVK